MGIRALLYRKFLSSGAHSWRSWRDAGKSHALHKRVEQLCTRAIKWAELKRKSKVHSNATSMHKYLV